MCPNRMIETLRACSIRESKTQQGSSFRSINSPTGLKLLGMKSKGAMNELRTCYPAVSRQINAIR